MVKKEQVEKWIEEGSKYICKSKLEEWVRSCEYEIDGYFRAIPEDTNGIEFDVALNIIKQDFENESLEEMQFYFLNQQLTDDVAQKALDIILAYANHGPKIYAELAKMYGIDISEDIIARMNNLNNSLKAGKTFKEALKDVTRKIIVLNNDETEGKFVLEPNGVLEGFFDTQVVIGRLKEDSIYLVKIEKDKDEFSVFYGTQKGSTYIGREEIYSIALQKVLDNVNAVYKIKTLEPTFYGEDTIRDVEGIYKRNLGKNNQRLYAMLLQELNEFPDLPIIDFNAISFESRKR